MYGIYNLGIELSKFSEFTDPKSIMHDSETQTMIEDIFKINTKSTRPYKIQLDAWMVPTILTHLNKICPKMIYLNIHSPPIPKYNTNSDKLNEIFARIFQSLDLKIKQLNNKTILMFQEFEMKEYKKRENLKRVISK